MKTYYQLCVFVGFVLRVHSGPLTPSPVEDDEEFAKVSMTLDHLKLLRIPVGLFFNQRVSIEPELLEETVQHARGDQSIFWT